MLLSIDNIYKYYNGEPILDGISLNINEGERIGLVGVNGSGKTTLLSIITGKVPYDRAPDGSGELNISGTARIGYLEQGVGLSSERSIADELRLPFSALDAEKERMTQIEAELGALSGEELSRAEAEYDRLKAHFEANDGYLIDVKIKTVLNGMGFSGVDAKRSVNSLSGGERTRLALAKLLLEAPNLLILDEPTNHLDLDTMQWLEDYLLGYKGAILTVSHNRYFLDKVATRICELEYGRLSSYPGNYTRFVSEKRAQTARAEKLYKAEQAKIKELQFFIDKNRASATSAKAAKSKQHMLDRILENAQDKPFVYHKPAKISLEYDIEPPKEVFEASGLEISPDGGRTVILDSFSLSVRRGERVCIIGPNGAGKSTVLKAIQGLIPCRKGKRFWAENTKIAYFDQKNEQLDPSLTVIEELHRRYPAMTDQSLRSLLGRVLLSGESVYKPIGVLSGGEKTKLSFALLMLRRGNVLILDEPTNHLDISTKEVLEDALTEYTGTVILVSHDRYLLNKLATKIIEIKDGVSREYKGSFDDYLAARELSDSKKEEKRSFEPQKKQYRTKSQRAEDAKKRQRLYELEAKISGLEEDIKAIEEEICQPDSSRSYQKMSELCLELEDKKELLSRLSDEWLELSE